MLLQTRPAAFLDQPVAALPLSAAVLETYSAVRATSSELPTAAWWAKRDRILADGAGAGAEAEAGAAAEAEAGASAGAGLRGGTDDCVAEQWC